MLDFKKLNNVVGWALFAVATLVYTLTIEPTASYWHCGEFIACAYKLQVPHPPGAPFFLLVGRMFSLLAFGDLTQVAFWINMVSALSSSLTVLFLFWTITLLARKVVTGRDVAAAAPVYTAGQTLAVLGSGLIGAAAFMFSDSFWFSAAEAEVYAMSSLFTALVFWAILKWETVADAPDSDRWLILIAYLMGLSIGVHLLNLVTIPALGFVYYFRRAHHQYSLTGVVVTLAVSALVLGIILVGIIPGLPSVAGRFELIFVNNLNLPFGSGIIFFVLLFVGALVWSVRYSIRHGKHQLNTALLALVFILIGYASYGIIVIRSNYNPPIDENDPENIISFVSYLKREQYGDRPLLYGPQYTARLIDQERGAALYRKAEDSYQIYDYRTENKFDKAHFTLLPRIYSTRPDHVEAYKQWVSLSPQGDRKPTFGDNLTFLFRYQIGFMYWRYFMWNFAGRESDVQNAGWLSPWASARELPPVLKHNKGRNQFFMLPLLLGILGLIYQINRRGRDALIVGLLFFFTGIAIVLYLNQPPVEPRERDYTFAGSFYAFSIWIGLGVLAVWDYLGKLIKGDAPRAAAATALCAVVPVLMGAQGWDDHDRSSRYHSVDSAKNLLNSCAPNAVIFTGGDNDTFPLWYVQEVEGFRTDVRVCNLSLLNTDWYIKQMKAQAYDSDPLPISLDYEDYIQGKNDYVPFVENPRVPKSGLNLDQYIRLVREDNAAIKVSSTRGEMISTLPSKTFTLPVDVDHVRSLGFLTAAQQGQLQDRITWNYDRGALEKKDLIMLDMIVTNNWNRPIYFSSTLSPSNYLNLREYMQVEGLAYRLMPVRTPGAQDGEVNTDIMFANMMENYFYRNLDDPHVYYDENYQRFTLNLRGSFYRLAAALFNEGKREQAKAAIDFCLTTMPDNVIPYDFYIPQFIPLLLALGEEEKALAIADTMGTRAAEELAYYTKYKPNMEREIRFDLIILSQIVRGLQSQGKAEEARKYEEMLERYYPGAGAN